MLGATAVQTPASPARTQDRPSTAAATQAQVQITQADLIRRVIDLDRLWRRPAGERTGMFSSYDRRSRLDAQGKYLDWDANADAGNFLRAEEDGWQLMAEMTGPGAITRIWSANPHGRIRVVLDGDTAIETAFVNLFNGQMSPLVEPLCYVTPGGGHNCYFPIGYNRSCRVLAKNCASYYQINYVSFRTGTQVQRFAWQLDEAADQALADVMKVLMPPAERLDDDARMLLAEEKEKLLFGRARLSEVTARQEISAGQKLELETFGGGGIIRALYVGMTDRALLREPYALHQCVLRIYFDHEATPGVEAPLVDFFGSGFGLVPYGSLVCGTELISGFPGDEPERESRFCYCYFPMPYQEVARVEIESPHRARSGLRAWLRVERGKPPADALRFCARFRKEDPCQVLDYPILETRGAGRIVGCVLNVDCPRQAWWGEGDDKVWIDGEAFPSYFGTGSEDYLGDAWGLHVHARPLQGATRAGAYGKASAYRWHIPDCINFEKSVRFTIENLQHAGVKDTYYSSVVYWYGEPAAEHGFARLSPEDLAVPGLRIPNSVEVEDHILGEGWGNLMKEKDAGGEELSGGAAAVISTDAAVEVVLPSDRQRVVLLKLRVHPRRPFDSVSVHESGGRLIGTVAYDRGAEGLYTVGLTRLSAGENRLTVRCRSPRATVLDCWVVDEVARTVGGPEGEDLQLLRADEGVVVATEFGTPETSGGLARVIAFSRAGQTVRFALPAANDGSHRRVELIVLAGPNGGRFEPLLDGRPAGEIFDTRAETPRLDRVRLATLFGPAAGELAFRAVGAGQASGDMRLALDAIELVPVRSPYAVECEDLRIVDSRGAEPVVQAIGGTSGGAHVWCRPTEPGAWIEFEVPIVAAGRYELAIVYTTSFDYGVVQTYVNGEKAGPPFDTFGQLQPGPIRSLGIYDLPAGPLRVRAEVVGKNEDSPGYYFGVDCIVVEPAGR